MAAYLTVSLGGRRKAGSFLRVSRRRAAAAAAVALVAGEDEEEVDAGGGGGGGVGFSDARCIVL